MRVGGICGFSSIVAPTHKMLLAIRFPNWIAVRQDCMADGV